MVFLNKKGFTFIETIIYTVIIGGVIVSFISFALSIQSSREKNYIIQETQANNRMALQAITNKIRMANGINSSTSIFGSDPGIISLNMASPSQDPTIIDLNQDDGVLRIKEGAQDAYAITSSKVQISHLIFTNFTSSSERENIGIEITARYEGDDANYTYEQSLKSSVSLRQ
ncbi:MAG: type II secretion system protein [bacterium]